MLNRDRKRGRSVEDFISREAIIRSVSEEQGVDPDLILELLALEPQHSNLHGYGARARLRRAAEALIDAAFAKLADTQR
jgi:hypothetical protein